MEDERTARIETKLDMLIKNFENHLRHHLLYSLMAWSAVLGLIASLVVVLLR